MWLEVVGVVREVEGTVHVYLNMYICIIFCVCVRVPLGMTCA